MTPKPHRASTALPFRPVLLALSAAALLAGCATAPPPAPPPPPQQPVTLRVIAFNDLHGHLEVANQTLPHPNAANPAQPLMLRVGGAAPLAGLVGALRATAPHSIVVSSGDLIGGTPLISQLFWHESTIDLMNRLGLDIATPGNHEFDAGAAELLRVMGGGCRTAAPGEVSVSCALGRHEGARFPSFSANIERADGTPLFQRSVVREVGGIRVGFIGAVTRTTPAIVVPSGVAGLRFLDEAEAINAEAARLQAQGVQALVAVVHEGGAIDGGAMEWNESGCPSRRGAIFDIERRLVPAIDVVLSAHTHQGYRCVVGDARTGRPVMQALSFGRGVSVLDLVLDPATRDIDRARSFHRNLPVFNPQTDPAHRELVIAQEPAPYAAALRAAVPDASIAARLAQYAERARPLAERPVGRIAGSFQTQANRGDMSAGRLIADAQWAATRAPDRGGAQLALMNPGGVRAPLTCRGTPPCEVTYGDVFTMQPFGNSLVVMTLSGAEFKQLLEDQQRPGREQPAFLLPSSSLAYRWVRGAPYGQRVQDLRIDGRPVQPGDAVRFTVNSFMAEGGDGFTGLRAGRDRLGGEVDVDALIAFLRTVPAPDPNPRVVVVD
jgi:5'-nucleotidase